MFLNKLLGTALLLLAWPPHLKKQILRQSRHFCPPETGLRSRQHCLEVAGKGSFWTLKTTDLSLGLSKDIMST